MEVLAHLSRTSALADAKDLLQAGVDGFVHLVRDRDVDNEYLAAVKAHPRVIDSERKEGSNATHAHGCGVGPASWSCRFGVCGLMPGFNKRRPAGLQCRWSRIGTDRRTRASTLPQY
jgi:hypothetical protein